MSNETTKYKVTLEFEVDINPISVPSADAFEKLSTAKAKKKPPSEAEFRKAAKAKGMSDADIKKYLAGAKAKQGDGAATPKPQNYQMLLYPDYESWAAAQQSLQSQILADDDLSRDYIREIVRDFTRGKIESLVEEKYGAPDLNGVLKQAMQKISAEDQVRLQADEESLLHDETELVEDSVNYHFKGLTVHPLL